MTIGVVNYGMGNLLSVYSAFESLGHHVSICNAPEDLAACSHIVIPGVGGFHACLKNLSENGFIEVLTKQVMELAKPTLGICLGMQAMASKGYEGQLTDGLGWVDATVEKIDDNNGTLKIPHIGWNTVEFDSEHPLFKGLQSQACFYFLHAYHMICQNHNDVIATCNYGGELVSAIQHENILATQFHPEKSQDNGMQLLENFATWKP